MSFFIAQILCLYLLCLFIVRIIPWKVLAYFFAVVSSVFIGMQIISVMLGNALIDYKYYAHINVEMAAESTLFFLKQILFGVLMTSLFMYSFHRMIKNTVRFNLNTIIFSLLIFIGTIVFMSTPHGVIYNLYDISKLHFAKKKQFNEALDQLGFDNYTPKKDIEASPGKNIIFIAMESLEAAFLKDNLAHLTPNLRRLSKEMNYYDMIQIEGGSYTIGAQYTYLTGLPMYFKNHGNDVFQKAFDFNIVTILDVLKKAGYNMDFMMGNPGFTGADVMFDLMGINVISEADYDENYKIRTWGLHDRDLFKLATAELKKRYQQESPFAFFISTISTHADDGVFDPRVAKDFPPQKSQLELMVRSLDHEVSNLVEFIQQTDPENTVIYIMPDHKLMGSLARVLNDLREPRDLFLMTNADIPSYKVGEKINQIDVAKMVLEGAAVSHNMQFLTDNISGNKWTFLNENRRNILQLNEAGIDRHKKGLVENKSPDEVNPNEREITLISQAWSEGNEDTKSYFALGKKLYELNRGFNVIEPMQDSVHILNFDSWDNKGQIEEFIAYIDEVTRSGKQAFIVVHDTAGKDIPDYKGQLYKMGFHTLSTLKNHRSYIGQIEGGFISERMGYKKLDIRLSKEELIQLRSPEQIAADARNPEKWIAHAGGVIDGVTYTNSLEAMDASYAKGFRYFELDIIETLDSHFVATHDWTQWRDRAGYGGDIPVDYKTFMKTKIDKKYTPMDMKQINKWFKEHPDAVLITDKVNEPVRFVKQFIDKKRLIMELFSLQAIEEAKAMGIRELLMNEELIGYLKRDKAADMIMRGIGGMSASIRTIEKDLGLFMKLKDEGIKVYAFHIGFDDLKDEGYMARVGLDACYGLYADDWQFN